MFLAALFTIAKAWEQPKYPLTEDQIKKIKYTHMVKYYSALKKKEILPFATTWMNLEDIMLCEINSTQKNKSCLIPLT